MFLFQILENPRINLLINAAKENRYATAEFLRDLNIDFSFSGSNSQNHKSCQHIFLELMFFEKNKKSLDPTQAYFENVAYVTDVISEPISIDGTTTCYDSLIPWETSSQSFGDQHFLA